MRVVFGRGEAQPPSLFAGQAWQDAAEAWALLEGDLTITRWQIDQRFACGPQWYRVDWREGEAGQLGEWVISPVD